MTIDLSFIDGVIRTINKNQGKLLQRAMSEGGPDMVDRLLEEIETLKDARFEMLRAELDEANPAYAAMIADAKAAADRVEKSVKDLERVEETLERVTRLVNLAARLVVRFAI